MHYPRPFARTVLARIHPQDLGCPTLSARTHRQLYGYKKAYLAPSHNLTLISSVCY